jgi:hypothetical protein
LLELRRQGSGGVAGVASSDDIRRLRMLHVTNNVTL